MQVADLFARLGFRVDKGSQAKATSSIQNFANKASSLLKPLAGLLGGAAIFGALKDNQAFSKGLVRLGIASQGTLGGLEQMRKQILDISDASGIAKESVMSAANSFIALTGDSKTAKEQLGLFGKVAAASGADMDDVARAGAALSQSMQVAGEDFEKAFSILIAGGKAGAVELKAVSQIMAKLSAVSNQFAGGKGVNGLADTAAGLQLVTRAFGGSASEGANAMGKLMGVMVRAAPKLKEFGVKVFNVDENGKKTRRNFQDIIEEISQSKLALDPTKLMEAFGSKEALAAYEQLVLVKDEWRNLADDTRSATDVADDYAKVSSQGSIRIAKAWNKLKNTISRGAAVITNVIMHLVDNFKAFAITVGLVGAAFIALNAVATWAAIKMAAAWVLGFAPLFIAIALIALLYLAIEDLIAFLSGEESLIGDLWGNPIKEWYKDIEAFSSWVIEQFEEIVAKAEDVLDYLKGNSTRADKKASKIQYDKGKKKEAEYFKKLEIEASNKKAFTEDALAITPSPALSGAAPAFRADLAGNSVGDTITFNMTIEGTSDPIATGNHASEMMSRKLKDK